MKVLYSVGPESNNDNLELRMSLRSLEKHGKNLTGIIVCGFPPDWLSDSVEKFYVEPTFTAKQDNILEAIVKTIDAGLVGGDFLYSSDDHFLVRDADLDDFPFYYRKDRIMSFSDFISSGKNIRSWSKYYSSCDATRSVLENNGYDAIDWSGHVNTHMHTDDLNEVLRLSNIKPRSLFGYEPTCLFMNVRVKREEIAPTFRKDIKIDQPMGWKSIQSLVGDGNTFSIGDGLLGNGTELRTVFESIYPVKSVFER